MTPLPVHLRWFRALWSISPYKMAFAAFACGFISFAVAFHVPAIGDVAFYAPKTPGTICTAAAIAQGQCIVKQVGYLHALNWSLVQLLLLPAAIYFAFDSVQKTRPTLERMAASRMLAREDWSSHVTDVGPIMRKVWGTFCLIAVLLFAAMAVFFARDWWCVVHTPIRLDVALGDVIGQAAREALLPRGVIEQLQASGCYHRNAHENDWSIASTFGSVRDLAPLAPGYGKPSPELAWAFSLFTYAFMALWSGIVISYFGHVLALAVAFHELSTGRYGFRLVLDLSSTDRRNRQGFESLEAVLRPCIFVSMIAFMMAFLMRIQNIYLRNVEYESIYGLLFGDIMESFSKFTSFGMLGLWEWVKDISATLRRFLDFEQFADPQSLLGAPVIFIILSILTAVLAYVLRGAAIAAQGRLAEALHDEAAGRRAAGYYGLTPQEAADRVRRTEHWPLSWPGLQYALGLMLSGIFCYVFYRMAFVWMGYVFARAVQGKFSDRA